ncbi:hypothetical protein NL676_007338 [Syzygium grande]|nr:hypothetical protein NL676_007338 [Syzygium grande]
MADHLDASEPRSSSMGARDEEGAHQKHGRRGVGYWGRRPGEAVGQGPDAVVTGGYLGHGRCAWLPAIASCRGWPDHDGLPLPLLHVLPLFRRTASLFDFSEASRMKVLDLVFMVAVKALAALAVSLIVLH